jgi:hypothetical protein
MVDVEDAAKFRTKLIRSIEGVERWVEEHHYRGYEPFDGLSSRLKPLTFGSLLLERLLQQAVRQSPLNLRPLIGVKPRDSTKGRGYMAWGYLQMLKATGDPGYKEKAVQCLDWLDKNKAPGYAFHSWGNHFDFSSRVGRLPRLEPIIVWSSLIGQAFLDAYEMLGESRFLDIARSICAWILELPRERTSTGSCLSYVAFTQRSIHNSNMLGAALLARTAKHARREDYVKVAREAMVSRQLPDGGWYYGEQEGNRWIDNFHTGYNLDSLKCYIDSTEDVSFVPQMAKGFAFYTRSFFEPTGCPKYYHDRVYPIDSQCASQAIETLANFAEVDSGALDLAVRVAAWTIDHMQGRDGHFYYRKYPLATAKTPMLHWAQATTFRALALLLNRIG